MFLFDKLRRNNRNKWFKLSKPLDRWTLVWIVYRETIMAQRIPRRVQMHCQKKKKKYVNQNNDFYSVKRSNVYFELYRLYERFSFWTFANALNTSLAVNYYEFSATL